MSIADDADVVVLIADTALVDASSKVNALGLGWRVTAVQQPMGLTPPFTLIVLIEVPARYIGEQLVLSLTLLNESGESVSLPGLARPAEANGPVFVLQQTLYVAPSSVPDMQLPDDFPSRLQATVQFPTGLPLPSGATYRWEIEIDGKRDPRWSCTFYVGAGPASTLAIESGPSLSADR